MKHNYNDLKIGLNSPIPATIYIYRGDQYSSLQEAREQGGTRHILDLEDIFDINIDCFHLANSLTIQDLFGESSMTYAVADDAQLFFEIESTHLTVEFLESYRMGLLGYRQKCIDVATNVDYKATIIGWNSEFGGSFAINYTYPATFTKDQLEECAIAFIQDISRDHAEDDAQDPENILFITNIIEGHKADEFKPYGHSEGRDQYNFPIKKMKEWEYKLLSGNVLWCGGDYGVVEAYDRESAEKLVRTELHNHFKEINIRLQGFDTFEFDEYQIEVIELDV